MSLTAKRAEGLPANAEHCRLASVSIGASAFTTLPMETSSSSNVYAGFWRRVFAAIIDTALSALIIGPIIWAIYGREYLDSDAIILGPADFLLTWVLPAVGVVLFWIHRSATPGKMAVHAKIVDARTGAHPSTVQLIVRYLGYYASILPLGLGLIWVAFDPRKQGFHDKLASTVVIHDR